MVRCKKWSGKTVVFLVTAVLAVFALSCYFFSENTKAKSKIYDLETDITYNDFNVTGDRQKDKIKIRTDKDSSGYISKLSVIINGKKIFSKRYGDSSVQELRQYPQVKLIELKKGKKLLYIHMSTYNGYYSGGWIYKIRPKLLRCLLKTKTIVRDYNKKYPKAWRTGERIKRVKGNRITFSVSSYTTKEKKYTFKYRNGRLYRRK